jgi:hypothetical protein
VKWFATILTISGSAFVLRDSTVVAVHVDRYNSAGAETSCLKKPVGVRAMDHELREKCVDLITRIKHLQDSL